MTPFLGELVGTMLLIIFGAGVVAGVSLKKSLAEGSGWIVITFGWGFAVAFAVYAVGSISGAHINPAVTIGLAVSGSFPWADVPSYILAQMIGAFLGAACIYLHYYPHWKETDDPGAKLGVFSTGPAIPNLFGNFFSEVFGTFILVVSLLYIGANEFTEGLNPLIVGFLIVAIGLSLGGTTGYAINPARDLGPRIAHFFLPIPGKGASNWSYAWIPVIAPIIGGGYAAYFYKFIFLGEGQSQFFIVSAILIALLIGIFAVSKQTHAKMTQKQVA
ncbi:MIP/aquaporin family protein [Bacillus carboniphilus]|uniref:MIP/aquaporin family protein n=1 Tax=Bacillus carboniphilus TaxID=86663 RepID=A0ABY9JTM1_9BACI|nr:MIP/aquaporin family protein [Bacillus carboniphilus]WLR42744.1 MIP/aquaporin family protein [Bacillus carboniphilus]